MLTQFGVGRDREDQVGHVGIGGDVQPHRLPPVGRRARRAFQDAGDPFAGKVDAGGAHQCPAADGYVDRGSPLSAGRKDERDLRRRLPENQTRGQDGNREDSADKKPHDRNAGSQLRGVHDAGPRRFQFWILIE